MFALIIPILEIGIKPAVIVLFLYALLSIIKNTYIGINSIDSSSIEAGKELGGTMIVKQALLSGDIDISLEYTGTGYIYLLKQSELKDSKKINEYVKKEFGKQGITWLNPLGFNNTYAFAVKEETAKNINLKKCLI